MLTLIMIFIIAFSLILELAVPQLRRSLFRIVVRSNEKQAFIAEYPDAHSALESYGRKVRYVHGKQAPNPFHVYPAQIEDKRELAKRMPKRFVEGQSFFWTLLVYLLNIVILVAGFILIAKH